VPAKEKRGDFSIPVFQRVATQPAVAYGGISDPVHHQRVSGLFSATRFVGRSDGGRRLEWRGERTDGLED